MDTVLALHNVSKQLYDILHKEITKDERDGHIASIEELITTRQTLIDALKPPHTVEEKRLGAEIVSINKDIDERLLQLKNTIKFDLTDIKKRKQSTNKYVNPYRSLLTDGVFYDKRK
ncbi:flagellar protein FliT [Bacillus sp. SCS-151]|uniref:flagellar protein FliT n=1 Tax=Nanhaiella sioensis TaxID=3115293 RepID=UPI003978A7C6